MTRMTRIRWQITPKLLQYYSSMATGALLVKQWSNGREVHRVVCRTGVLYTVSHRSPLHRVAPESFTPCRTGVLYTVSHRSTLHRVAPESFTPCRTRVLYTVSHRSPLCVRQPGAGAFYLQLYILFAGCLAQGPLLLV